MQVCQQSACKFVNCTHVSHSFILRNLMVVDTSPVWLQHRNLCPSLQIVALGQILNLNLHQILMPTLPQARPHQTLLATRSGFCQASGNSSKCPSDLAPPWTSSSSCHTQRCSLSTHACEHAHHVVHRAHVHIAARFVQNRTYFSLICVL